MTCSIDSNTQPHPNLKVTRRRRGAMMAFVAVTMVGLMALLAMTLDVGAGNRQRRIGQTATDAAALAGAAEIYRLETGGALTVTPVDAATAEATSHGFTSGGAIGVTAVRPPSTGPHNGDNRYIEVVITNNHPNLLAGVLGIGSLYIRTRAVAGVGTYSLSCIYSLDPTGASALNVQNGGEIEANCGVAVSSNHATAIDGNSSGTIGATGGISVPGGWTGNANKMTPDPTTGAAPPLNPLAYVSMPDPVPACTVTGLTTITANTTIDPGVYCGGILVTNKDLTLRTGTYIMRGGGFTVQTGGKVIGTSGVTIINSIDPTATYAFKPFDFGTGCKAKLVAQTTGAFKGILFFGDPAGPANVVNTFACASDDPPELTGSLYFPTQTMFFNGSNSGTTILGAVIAKTVDVKAKLTMINDTSGNSGLLRFSLVE